MSRAVEMVAGSTLTLTLGATPSIPCGWQRMSIGDEDVVKQIGRGTEWPAEGVTPMPGAPGVEIWVLRTLREGTSTVSVECTCLGQEGSAEELAGAFVLRITVR